ncbi:MAG: YhcH/YjgK/YiaL family protein [Opitutaceae bacterium]|nr:YhcH/YjgK/YiaL family protein [Opitutaceae bacterium]
MALFGSLQSVRAQAPRTEGFSTAFAYVDELLRPGSDVQARLRAIASGDTQKIDLAGGAFVIEQAFETKLRADGFFESHRKYMDVQVVVEGEELMEVADIARMTVRQAYNGERDLIIYDDSSDASLLRVFPGQVAVFFPADVHMPTLRIRATPVLVRKSVVKVPIAG